MSGDGKVPWRARRTSTIALVDQVASAAGNFAATIWVARTSTAHDFGIFAAVFVVYIMSVGFAQATISEPLVIGPTGTSASRPSRRDGTHYGSAVTATICLAGVLTALVLAAGALIAGQLGWSLMLMAILLPGLLLHDVLRYTAFANREPTFALMLDLGWLLVLFPSLGAVSAIIDTPSPAVFVVAWGAPGCIVALLGLWKMRGACVLRSPRSFLRGHRFLTTRYLGEFAAVNLSVYITLAAVGMTSGVRELGALRAAQATYGPVNVTFNAARLAVIAWRAVGQDTAALVRRAATLVSTASLGLAFVWSAILLSLPQRWGSALLGASWEPARSVIPALAVQILLLAMSSGAMSGLRALGAAQRSFPLRVRVAILYVGAGVTGAVYGGAVGAAWGMAAASSISAADWWWQFLQVTRRRTASTTGAPSLWPSDGTVGGP